MDNFDDFLTQFINVKKYCDETPPISLREIQQRLKAGETLSFEDVFLKLHRSERKKLKRITIVPDKRFPSGEGVRQLSARQWRKAKANTITFHIDLSDLLQPQRRLNPNRLPT